MTTLENKGDALAFVAGIVIAVIVLVVAVLFGGFGANTPSLKPGDIVWFLMAAVVVTGRRK